MFHGYPTKVQINEDKSLTLMINNDYDFSYYTINENNGLLESNPINNLKKSDLQNNIDAYKHYTWNQIINFSLVNRWSIDFRKGGGGDWKKVEADGYLIVTVNGTPYWADAIGQIPFAIDTMRDYIIKYNGDYTKAIKETINTGMEYGNGSIFFKEVDKSNTYDNYLVLRGCLWSKAKFKYAITKQTNGSEKKQLIMINSNFEEILDSNIKVTERDKYAQWNY